VHGQLDLSKVVIQKQQEGELEFKITDFRPGSSMEQTKTLEAKFWPFNQMSNKK
jgi:hypothetical protein